MYKDKTIGIVIPAHNESAQIGSVFKTMPSFVNKILVVDDCSTENTAPSISIGQWFPKAHGPITLSRHTEDFVNRYDHIDKRMSR